MDFEPNLKLVDNRVTYSRLFLRNIFNSYLINIKIAFTLATENRGSMSMKTMNSTEYHCKSQSHVKNPLTRVSIKIHFFRGASAHQDSIMVTATHPTGLRKTSTRGVSIPGGTGIHKQSPFKGKRISVGTSLSP